MTNQEKAELIKARLQELNPGIKVEIVDEKERIRKEEARKSMDKIVSDVFRRQW